MSKLAVCLSLLGAVGLVLSCGKSCDHYAAYSLTINLKDASGTEVCDSEVTATDGTEVFALYSIGCSFVGPEERSGTFVVSVSHAGRTTISEPFQVSSGECHVNGQRVELILAS